MAPRNDGARPSLTAAQLSLLGRIAEGVDPLTKAETQLANSVYALRSRGLVRTPTQHRSYWQATLTDAGQALLAESCALLGPDVGVEQPPPPLPAISPQAVIDGLLAGGGTLVVPDPSPARRRAWRQALRAVNAGALVGDGQRVRYAGRSEGDLVIRLERVGDAGSPPPPPPVRVPTRLLGLHPLLAATRAQADGEGGRWIDTRRRAAMAHVCVSRTSLNRALRLLHGLVMEATRRGHGVGVVAEGRCSGGLGLLIEGHGFEVVVMERTRRVRATPGPGPGRLWAPTWEFVPTGRLRLQMGHSQLFSPLAADGVHRRVEDRLAHVLATLEGQAAEAEAQAQAKARARGAKAQAEATALAQARHALAEHSRVAHLGEQVRAWRLSQDIKAMVAAARASAVGVEEQAWLTWALTYAEEINPLRHGLVAPATPTVTAAELKPFLRAAMGPDHLVDRYG